MGEFTIISELAERFGSPGATEFGRMGDDGVRLDVSRPVVVLDTMVEGVHFRLDWSTLADVGWKLLASNVSDLHACGASPHSWLLSLSLPGSSSEALAIARGLSEGFEAYMKGTGQQFPLVGGDTTGSPGRLVLSVTAVGVCESGFVARSAACAGQSVWVSGEPGWSAAGLHILQSGEEEFRARSGESVLIERALQAHRRPVPGQFDKDYLESGCAGAAIDVSDGLAADLLHVARASGVRVVLDQELPGTGVLCELAEGDAGLVRSWQMDGGEDYVLAVTSASCPGEGWIRIGVVEAGEPGLLVAAADGSRRHYSAHGWEHLR